MTNKYFEDFLNSDNYKELQKTIETFNKIALVIQDNASKALEPLKEVIKKRDETVEAIRNNLKSLFDELNTLFENPNSVFSYLDYYRVLSKYFWVLPYKIQPEHLKEIIKACNDEEEFDRFMLDYFTEDLLLDLEGQTLKLLPDKHSVIFNQSINSFNRGDYALCCLGLFSIIDDSLSFYIEDKGNTHRATVLQPIANDVMSNASVNEMYVEDFVLLMMNENIKVIYDNVDFASGCNIQNKKGVSRNASSHGKLYSNKKESNLMLLNSLYYLKIIENCFKQYKDKLSFNKKKKTFYIKQQ